MLLSSLSTTIGFQNVLKVHGRLGIDSPLYKLKKHSIHGGTQTHHIISYTDQKRVSRDVS